MSGTVSVPLRSMEAPAVPWTCPLCKETFSDKNTAMDHHWKPCPQERIVMARANAQTATASVVHTLAHIREYKILMRSLDRLSPDEAAELADYIEAYFVRHADSDGVPNYLEEPAYWHHHEIRLWMLRRRAAGERVWPWSR